MMIKVVKFKRRFIADFFNYADGPAFGGQMDFKFESRMNVDGADAGG